jgi:predicted nucleotidyltransferase
MADFVDRGQINQIALKYAEYLKKEYKLCGVYVYGSYAKGNFTADSDIDIAVVAEDFTGDLVEDTFRLMKLRRKVDYRIEPRPFMAELFNESNPEAREVMETGIRIA